MLFKYFDKPELFTKLRDAETTCDTCGQEKVCFDAESFCGNENLKSICPECLSNGQLKNKNVSTCNGDIEALKKQLKILNPAFTDIENETIAQQKTTELEKTTPHLITWQDWNWPCADGDYCKFIGYGSKPLYMELAENEQVELFFKNSFYDSNFYEDYLWDELPDKSIDNYIESEQYFTLFYVFKSLNSDKIFTTWDCG